MDVLFLNERQVAGLIDIGGLLRRLEDGFAQLSAGEGNAPGRNEIAMPREAFLLGMPGHRPESPMTVKVVTVFEATPRPGLPSHMAIICQFDPETGACRAFLDGTYITAV